jgi:hypothetical protein
VRYSATIDRGAPEELHVQLAEIIRGQIQSGELPPRSKLHPQLDIAHCFGVSTGNLAVGVAATLATCGLLGPARKTIKCGGCGTKYLQG